jgi:hypothetical protein
VWCERLEEEAFTKAAVVAKSKRFVWLLVNRDRTPDVPKRFNVSAYPTLLTLGDDLEKVHRFHGFRTEAEVLAELDDALARYAKYREGEEWDTPKPRPERLCEDVETATFPAPTGDVPAGITVWGDDLWVGQLGKLRRVRRDTGKLLAEFDLPRSVLDLCTDGKLLYAVESGWTAGKPIHVLDPTTGKELRRIVTEANRKSRALGAKGIAWRNGKLYVLAGMRGVIHELDPADGRVLRSIRTPKKWLAGLDVQVVEGRATFVAASRTHLFRFDAETGELVSELPVNYPLRCVAVNGADTYVMEQPVFGYDEQHRRVQEWPRETLVYRLRVPAKRRAAPEEDAGEGR